MSLRSGNNTKKGQANQNTYAFKHNKSSKLTKIISKVPLDNLCKRCLDQLEWRIDYRKYKPLTAPSRCNSCQDKTIYKAYRTICDKCSITNKLCAKCAQPVDSYQKPTSWRNDPNFRSKKNNPIKEIIAELKERHKRTCERKLAEGEKLEFDEERGIINSETKELIIDIQHVYYNPLNRSDENSENDEDIKDKKENDIMDKISDNEDDISDDEIDGVLDELSNNKNKINEINCKENIK